MAVAHNQYLNHDVRRSVSTPAHYNPSNLLSRHPSLQVRITLNSVAMSRGYASIKKHISCSEAEQNKNTYWIRRDIFSCSMVQSLHSSERNKKKTNKICFTLTGPFATRPWRYSSQGHLKDTSIVSKSNWIMYWQLIHVSSIPSMLALSNFRCNKSWSCIKLHEVAGRYNY